ncbi:MAG: pSer/pThr/pTyr-binding forkhead associated (FHA) protein [Myxococcota bacterium]|jgi:pSer/pThr/pTyr-binding forkhead associated (FHA) protein
MKGRAFLFLESGRRVYRCQFTKNLTIIGSQDSNDIVIRDDSVAAEHAQISRADDAYTLRPLHNSELRVDGDDIESAYELINGDRIEIGNTDILFVREQAESPTTIHLIIRRGSEPPMGFWTSRSTVTIGRERGDIIIDDPLLSKVHAVIENFCDGGHFIIDARSERGTGLNGESLDARHRLVDGDTISLGSVEIEFRSKPYDHPTGRDAARLAAERIDRLRQQGSPDAVAAPAQSSIPRNPYQRYPSSLPASSAVPTPKRPGRLDMRSGVTTGISEARPRSAEPSVGNVRPSGGHNSPAPALHEPRPAGQSRGFGNRSEQKTQISSAGNRPRTGRWYLPDGQSAPHPVVPRTAENSEPNRPRIRRPDPEPRPPQRPGSTSPHSRPQRQPSGELIPKGEIAPKRGAERWYAPGDRKRPTPKPTGGGGAWYLPDGETEANRPQPRQRQRPIDRDEKEAPKSGGTQVFDGSDY